MPASDGTPRSRCSGRPTTCSAPSSRVGTAANAFPSSPDPRRRPHMRILHTMIRVGNLDRSIEFYTSVLGMKLLRRHDYPEGRFTLAFVGFGSESEQAVIELTHNWDTPSYDLGNGFGHVAVEVPDASAACAEIKKRGGVVTREAGPMKHGKTVIAFVQDPDGYKIELIQRKP